MDWIGLVNLYHLINQMMILEVIKSTVGIWTGIAPFDSQVGKLKKDPFVLLGKWSWSFTMLSSFVLAAARIPSLMLNFIV